MSEHPMVDISAVKRDPVAARVRHLEPFLDGRQPFTRLATARECVGEFGERARHCNQGIHRAQLRARF